MDVHGVAKELDMTEKLSVSLHVIGPSPINYSSLILNYHLSLPAGSITIPLKGEEGAAPHGPTTQKGRSQAQGGLPHPFLPPPQLLCASLKPRALSHKFRATPHQTVSAGYVVGRAVLPASTQLQALSPQPRELGSPLQTAGRPLPRDRGTCDIGVQ